MSESSMLFNFYIEFTIFISDLEIICSQQKEFISNTDLQADKIFQFSETLLLVTLEVNAFAIQLHVTLLVLSRVPSKNLIT